MGIVESVKGVMWARQRQPGDVAMVVAGQGYGSITQGLGQAIYEEASYSPDGSPAAETLLGYLLPTAADLPAIELLETQTPNPNADFGAKGAGEAGCIGAPPAVVNAVCDALGIDHIDMPSTPETVWRSLRGAAAGAPSAGRRIQAAALRAVNGKKGKASYYDMIWP